MAAIAAKTDTDLFEGIDGAAVGGVVTELTSIFELICVVAFAIGVDLQLKSSRKLNQDS